MKKIDRKSLDSMTLVWDDASSDVEGKWWTAWDRNPERTEDDVYLVESRSRTYYARKVGDKVICAVAVESRPASERSLFLDFYEVGVGKTVWNWKDLDTDESSQEFESEEEVLQAMRDEQLEWDRLDD